MEAAEVVVLSGTLTPQAPADFYARCVVMAAGCGVRTIVDAQGLPLELALAAHPTVVKPNRAELAATLKMPVDTDADLRMAMGKLVERGVGNVVVSLGAEGVAATDGQEYWRLTVPKVPVINSIGSGDALAAGLAVGLARNMDLAHACQLGAACGTANAMTLLAGEVDTEEVRRLVEQVEIE